MPRQSSLARPILLRATIAAAVIGTILTLVAQPDALLGHAAVQWLPLILVYATPFVVVTLSQILGVREARRAIAARTPVAGSFFATAASHGILPRAVLMGLAAATVNTAIVALANLLAGNGLSAVPLTLVAQALVLPALFGVLSQTLAFRRAVAGAASASA